MLHTENSPAGHTHTRVRTNTHAHRAACRKSNAQMTRTKSDTHVIHVLLHACDCLLSYAEPAQRFKQLMHACRGCSLNTKACLGREFVQAHCCKRQAHGGRDSNELAILESMVSTPPHSTLKHSYVVTTRKKGLLFSTAGSCQSGIWA